MERGGDEEPGEPDAAADEVVSATPGEAGAASPSDAAPLALVPTASVSASSGMGEPTPIDPDVSLERGCVWSASVVRHFLTEVGLRPEEVKGATD